MTTGRELERVEQFGPPPLPTDQELERYWRLGKMFYAAHVYKDIAKAEEAVAKLIVGRDLGLTVAQSMQAIQFVRGNLQVHYATLAMIIRARGFSWKRIERSDTRAAATFYDPDGNELDEVEFTIENAERAGLTKPSSRGEPSMYTKYPRNMLWARMISDAVRFVIPEATGGVPVYIPGEIEPAAELTEGEGTGAPRGVELAPEVEGLIARAEALGHAGWAERSAWEYRADRGAEVLAKSLAEATADLDELEATIPDVEEVEPDIPIDTEGLPDLSASADEAEDLDGGAELLEGRSGEAVEPPGSAVRDLGGGDAPADDDAPDSSASEGSDGEAVAQDVPEIEALRAQRRVYGAIKADTPEEQEEKDALMTALDQKIEALSQKEAAENPQQEKLI